MTEPTGRPAAPRRGGRGDPPAHLAKVATAGMSGVFVFGLVAVMGLAQRGADEPVAVTPTQPTAAPTTSLIAPTSTTTATTLVPLAATVPAVPTTAMPPPPPPPVPVVVATAPPPPPPAPVVVSEQSQ